MRPLLGSGNTNLHSLLQSLLGMQHRPGVSTLYLGTLNLSQNELSNSSLYFIEVTLAETSENSLTTLETRVGLSRQPLPTEEWERGNHSEEEHPQGGSSGCSGFGTAFSKCLSPETFTKLFDPLFRLLSGFKVQDS